MVSARLTKNKETFRTGETLNQGQIATVAAALCRHYPGCNATDEQREEHLLRVRNTIPVSKEVALDVGVWVGVYLDEAHDKDYKMGGYAWKHDFETEEWMEWAYDMLTDGEILGLNNG
jgi:hypothetical protein